jgi:D-alanyl-D-alanine carboxypeptidase
VQAVAVAVTDASSGQTLVSSNADARLAPASLTKMMTALVALNRGDLTAPVVATTRSLSEPTIIGLDPGDRLTLEEMLYGLLLPSGNDAALAIAESVGGGSIEQFVSWMNARAAVMGLRNTHFQNPHGLDSDGHFSSARDMAEIARVVMHEPVLARIVGTARYVSPGPPRYLFVNNNPLLGSYDGADGVKTGFTDAAGRTYAVSAARGGQRLIAVLFNSPDIRSEGARLLDLGFSGTVGAAFGVVRAGFAQLRILEGSSGTHWVRLAGWELPFLRGFTRRSGDLTQSTVYLGMRPIARWTE